MRDQSSVMPGSVSVRFQTRRCNGQPTDEIPQWYVKTIDIENVLQSVTGSFGNKTFHDRAIAEFDVSSDDPINKGSLDNLSDRIAIDFYNWLQDSFDESFPQVIAPTLDALTDTIEFVYRPENQSTRRYSSSYNDQPEEFQHHIRVCSGAMVDVNNIGNIVPCFESYGPPVVSVPNQIDVKVFKNCLSGGILTQEYVRTDSTTCNCAPLTKPLIRVVIHGRCPGYPEYDSYPGPTVITVKLFKGSTFIENGIYHESGSIFQLPILRWYEFGNNPSNLTPLEPGNDYHIEIDDTYPNFHSFISPNFTVTNPMIYGSYLDWSNYDIYTWLGWAEIGVDYRDPCFGVNFRPGEVTITANQNGNSKEFIFNDMFFTWQAVGPFIDYDPITLIPYDIEISVVPTSSRISTRNFTLKWENVVNQFKCTVYGHPDFKNQQGWLLPGTGAPGPNPSIFDQFSCGNCQNASYHQGDVTGGYVCIDGGRRPNGQLCLPSKKDLILIDSAYGACSLTFNECDGVNPCVWKGSNTATSTACNFVLGCGPDPNDPEGKVIFINTGCPGTAVTINYEFRKPASLKITYLIHDEYPCPFFPQQQGFICAGPGLNEKLIELGFFGPNDNPANNSCGETLFLEFEFGTETNNFCRTEDSPDGRPLATNGIYPNGTIYTLTVMEA